MIVSVCNNAEVFLPARVMGVSMEDDLTIVVRCMQKDDYWVNQVKSSLGSEAIPWARCFFAVLGAPVDAVVDKAPKVCIGENASGVVPGEYSRIKNLVPLREVMPKVTETTPLLFVVPSTTKSGVGGKNDPEIEALLVKLGLSDHLPAFAKECVSFAALHSMLSDNTESFIRRVDVSRAMFSLTVQDAYRLCFHFAPPGAQAVVPSIATPYPPLLPLVQAPATTAPPISSGLPDINEKTDAFVTHEWGDGPDYAVHEYVMQLNTKLKAAGLRTWFDADRMTGQIPEQMQKGIKNASIVIVCLTKRYVLKASGDAPNKDMDNVYLEYNYAAKVKGVSKMIVLVMEDAMTDTTQWGKVEFVMGNKLYVTMRREQAGEMDAQFGFLLQQMANMGVVPQQQPGAVGGIPARLAASDAPDEMLDADIDKALNPTREALAILQFASRLEYVWTLLDKERIKRQKERKYDDAMLLETIHDGVRDTLALKTTEVQDHGTVIFRTQNQADLFEALEEKASESRDLPAAKLWKEKYDVIMGKLGKLKAMRSADLTLDLSGVLGNQAELSRKIMLLQHKDGQSFASMMHAAMFPADVMVQIEKWCAELRQFAFVQRDFTQFNAAALAGCKFSRSDLERANFSGCNLTNMDLSGANLQNANLSKCQLMGANISGSTLKGVILAEVDLSEWDMSGLDLTNANLTNANLTNANLTKTVLKGVNFTGVDLSDRDFTGYDFTNANLTNANLANAKLNDANLTNSVLVGVNLTGVDISGRDFTGFVLTSANLTNADLSSVNLAKANLVNAKLTNANLTKAVLRDFSGLNLRQNYQNRTFSDQLAAWPMRQGVNFNDYDTDANLINAVLTGVNFTGVDLSGRDFSGYDLSKANLTNAYLIDADLTNANLTNANLTNTDLSRANIMDANFTGVNLTGRNFSGHDLTNVNFTNANLTNTIFKTSTLIFDNLTNSFLNNTNLANLMLRGVNFTGVDLSGRDCTGCDFSNANFTDANFTNAVLTNANLTNVVLKGVNFTGVNLTGRNFTCYDLTSANFTNANLTNANLCNANLTNTNLTNANLRSVNLTGVDLTGRDFTGFVLTDVNFTNANLTNVIFTNATLNQVNFTGVDLTDRNFSGINLTGANFSNANLTKANLAHAILADANFSNANLTSAILTCANLVNARLTKATLDQVNFTGLVLNQVNFTSLDLSGRNLSGCNFVRAIIANANLTNANFENANLTNAILTNTNFENANFTNANLTSANLTGANLTNANLINANVTGANLTSANTHGMHPPKELICPFCRVVATHFKTTGSINDYDYDPFGIPGVLTGRCAAHAKN